MPGLGFLFKKSWHPSRLDNEKKLFINEQLLHDEKQKEVERRKEVRKEQEIKEYEDLGQLAARDPKDSSLKFMYSIPLAKEGETKVEAPMQVIF